MDYFKPCGPGCIEVYKNPENTSCIDLILTHNPKYFQSSCVVETGLSDFHRITVTVIKTIFKKFEPRIIHYRDYKNFQNDQYRDELTPKLSNIVSENNNIRLNEFLSICMDTLDQYAPCKQKYTRGNHLPFMNKTISKEIMKRTRFRNQFLKNRTDENKSRYTKQRNYCVSLLRKTKTQYYSNLDEKNVTDNKAFWKTVKPFLSDKITSKEKITLIEENEIVSNDENTAQVLNTFFSNIVGNLNTPEYATNGSISDNINNPIIKLIVKYRKHPSILTIGEVCKERKKKHAAFSFSKVAKEEIFREILNLDVSKACQDTDIPSKIIKENADIFASFLHSSFNTSVTNSEFPSVLKQANITPVFKKGERYSKDNYRPVSILPNVSKIFERCMFRQINEYMDVFLSKHQCGFRKGYSTHNISLPCLKSGDLL